MLSFTVNCSGNDSIQDTCEEDSNLLMMESINSNNFVLDVLPSYVRSPSHPKECVQHRRSDVIEFIDAGRKIQKGSCLGHSQKGCINFSGIDLETGQLLYITEWNIKYSQLKTKCATKCKRENSTTPCSEHGVDEVIANVNNQMIRLAQIRHSNLVHYECVQCEKNEDGIFVYLAQDFILGNSVGNISTSLGWSEQSASMVAKSIVDAIIFLHSKHVNHGLLYDTAVYIDNCSTIRVTDFALVPYLQDLMGVQTIIKNDLEALGVLIESLLSTPSTVMRHFIDKCCSQVTLLATDLLDDPFLKTDIRYDVDLAAEEINKLEVITPKCTDITTSMTSVSRFRCDYTNIEYLGEGGFGEVYKAKNILDNRQYAIKKILLPEKSQKLYEDMTREVKVLSRLNHENVVRYYTSWTEMAPSRDEDEKMSVESEGWSSSIQDSVEFLNSSSDQDDDVECLDYDYEDSVYGRSMLQYMYIQMEYCNGSTLRTIIDNQLFSKIDRLWRLFREIVEGLAHIHQQGMIHRDLKPANIFIGSRDRIKIGDFGLATPCRLAPKSKDQPRLQTSIEVGTSLTKNVGTVLYSAPELSSGYNRKVDLYSLGVILFEMSCAPFTTGMERNQVLTELRKESINMPENFLNDPKYQTNAKVIRLLLNHNADNRPTAKELLNSELIPRAKLEINEHHEIMRNIIANPQSQQYKNLIARCLDQESDAILDLTYNHVPVYQNSVEYVKSRVVSIFRKHGAIEMVTPLLTPCSKNYVIDSNTVRLMTHSGTNVFLPRDLRLPFARHIAINGINSIRRYSIERVYREEKDFNVHPKQLYECAFDIVTPNPGNLLVDAELILIAHEIINEIPALQQKNISIRINHTTLLRAILLYFNVASSKYDEVICNLLDHLNGNIAKNKIKQILTDTLRNAKKSLIMFNMLTTPYIIGGSNASCLSNLIKGRGAAASLAKAAIRDVESVIRLAQELGVSCSISLLPGLSFGNERGKSGGIVWQMIAEEKFLRNNRRYVLAVGERYDTFLSEFQNAAHNDGIHLTKTEISGAGFSFSLESLMHAYGTSSVARGSHTDWAPLQVLVCLLGPHPPLKDVIDILKSLWDSGICSGFIESLTMESARDMARKLGARHLVVLNENGGLTLRSFVNHNMLQDRQITNAELINTVQRMMEPDEHNYRVINNALKQKISVLQQEKFILHKKLKRAQPTTRLLKKGSKREGSLQI